MMSNLQVQPGSNLTTDHFVAEVLADVRAGTLKLPILPRVAFKVRQIVDDQESNSEDVAKIISTDAALSTRLLQLANSPMYRGSLLIKNIPMAVTRLGLASIRTIVISLMVKQLYEIKNKTLRAPLERVWRHSIEVAAIARVLAAGSTALDPDEAMLGGLVHDIGVLPVIAKAEQFPEVAADAGALDAVCDQLHQAVGKLILQTWKLPSTLIDVAGMHEDWRHDGGTQAEYLDTVIVANLHARAGSRHPSTQVNWDQVPAFKKIGLNADESLNLIQDAGEELAHIRTIFS